MDYSKGMNNAATTETNNNKKGNTMTNLIGWNSVVHNGAGLGAVGALMQALEMTPCDESASVFTQIANGVFVDTETDCAYDVYPRNGGFLVVVAE